jgi:hypothetical protein
VHELCTRERSHSGHEVAYEFEIRRVALLTHRHRSKESGGWSPDWLLNVRAPGVAHNAGRDGTSIAAIDER